MLATGPDLRVDFERGMRTAPPLILLLIAANVALFGWELAAGALSSRESIIEAVPLVRDRVPAREGRRPDSATVLQAGEDHLARHHPRQYPVEEACGDEVGVARP